MLDSFFFFFNDTATTEIYTLSLHDALPISVPMRASQSTTRSLVYSQSLFRRSWMLMLEKVRRCVSILLDRSEEHTSELQSRQYLVCRLLLEKKKRANHQRHIILHDSSQRRL